MSQGTTPQRPPNRRDFLSERAGTRGADGSRVMKLMFLLVALTACAATAPDQQPAGAPEDNGRTGDLTEDSAAITGCTSVTTVLLYSEETFELRLPLAFAGAVDRCTRYYVDLPHATPDSTMPRP